jgi:hypothetical protein
MAPNVLYAAPQSLTFNHAFCDLLIQELPSLLGKHHTDSTAQMENLSRERGRPPSLVHALKQLAKVTTKIDQQLFVETTIPPGLSTHYSLSQ